MTNKLSGMLDFIQYKTKKNLKQISDDIGYARTYLSVVRNSDEQNQFVEKRLKEVYGDILAEYNEEDFKKEGINESGEFMDKVMYTAIMSKLELIERVVSEVEKRVEQALANSEIQGKLIDSIQVDLQTFRLVALQSLAPLLKTPSAALVEEANRLKNEWVKIKEVLNKSVKVGK